MADLEEHAEHAELAALADGSLSTERAAALRERVAASPELQALLAQQERAIALLQGLDEELVAPAALRARIESRADGRRRATAGRRFRLAPASLGSAVAVAVALGVALFLVIPGGTSNLTVQAVAAAATQPPQNGPPPPRLDQPKLLNVSVQSVPFPNYAAKFGWRAAGLRRASVDGHAITTVYYQRGGGRIAYSIVAGDPLEPPGGARPAVVEGTRLLALDAGGHPVVTWTRHGRTCVMTGTGVPRRTLLTLAGWKGMGAIPF